MSNFIWPPVSVAFALVTSQRVVLPLGAVADGQFLKRVGATIVGAAAGQAIAATIECATDIAIPTASGFVSVTSLALPAGVASGDTVDLWFDLCGVNSVGATVSYELRQGATVINKGYFTLTAAFANSTVGRRLVALVSNAAVALFVSTNSGTYSCRPATIASEHARIGLVKY